MRNARTCGRRRPDAATWGYTNATRANPRVDRPPEHEPVHGSTTSTSHTCKPSSSWFTKHGSHLDELHPLDPARMPGGHCPLSAGSPAVTEPWPSTDPMEQPAPSRSHGTSGMGAQCPPHAARPMNRPTDRLPMNRRGYSDSTYPRGYPDPSRVRAREMDHVPAGHGIIPERRTVAYGARTSGSKRCDLQCCARTVRNVAVACSDRRAMTCGNALFRTVRTPKRAERTQRFPPQNRVRSRSVPPCARSGARTGRTTHATAHPSPSRSLRR